MADALKRIKAAVGEMRERLCVKGEIYLALDMNNFVSALELAVKGLDEFAQWESPALLFSQRQIVLKVRRRGSATLAAIADKVEGK